MARPGGQDKVPMHPDVSQGHDVSHCCILTNSIMLIVGKVVNEYLLDDWLRAHERMS